MVNPATGWADPNPLILSDNAPVLELAIEHAVVWPIAGSEGFILENADDVNGPWAPVSVAPVEFGNRKLILTDSASSRIFYRLRKT